MIHEPSGFLSHANMLGKLDAGNPLASCREQINRNEPLLERQFRFPKNSSGHNGKIFFARSASVAFSAIETVNLLMAAMRAVLAIGKTNGGKMIATSLLVREMLQEILQRFKI